MFWNIVINLILLFFFNSNYQASSVKIAGNLISPKPGTTMISISAKRGALLPADDHYFLFEQKANQVQAIASISKLMTALVFLDNNPGWDKIYKITKKDSIPGGKVHLFLGEELTVRDLFYTSLIASDNGATLALAHSTGLSQEDFVKEMNIKAKELGLIHTHFEEPTGLSDHDVSTAREVALLAQAAFKKKEIRQATSKVSYTYKTLSGRSKKIESTDYLLSNENSSSLHILGGKTGYTEAAGYSFVGLFQKNNGPKLIAVVLNSSSINERFLESESLVDWANQVYFWKKD